MQAVLLGGRAVGGHTVPHCDLIKFSHIFMTICTILSINLVQVFTNFVTVSLT